MSKLSKLAAAAAVVGLMAGCSVTPEQLEEVRTAAEQAQAEAAEAKALAEQANARAVAAEAAAVESMGAAEAAQVCCDETNAKIDNMFKKAMQK
jgi:hypothetical protein